MRMRWLMCVLLGALAWGQASTPPATPAPQSAPAHVGPMIPGMQPGAPKTAAADKSDSVPDSAPVLTVDGVCEPAAARLAPAAKGAAAKPATATKSAASDGECKTIITKAEFERLANAVAPNITPQMKQQLASVLPRLIAWSAQARKEGLDKTQRFKETVKFAQMQILTNELQRDIQDESAKVKPEDIAEYYKENQAAYEQFSLERLFVPKQKQPETESAEADQKNEKLTEEQMKEKQADEKAKQAASEQEMTKLADSLRARAAAGEDFAKLEKEAFEAAGMKVESPTIALPKVRRTGLPAAHVAVFDLKPGEVSAVINDTGGHYIYKMVSKEELGPDQVKDEIHNALANLHGREATDKINSSYKVVKNEDYFGAGAATPMPPRGMSPRMPPSPMTPQPRPQTPPAPAPQSPSPDTKPN
jgi:hypothetical protein